MRVKLLYQRLAQELARKHISLNCWASKLGFSRGHLSQLVNGRRPYPDPQTRQKLQDGLHLKFEDLFEVVLPDERKQ